MNTQEVRAEAARRMRAFVAGWLSQGWTKMDRRTHRAVMLSCAMPMPAPWTAKEKRAMENAEVARRVAHRDVIRALRSARR